MKVLLSESQSREGVTRLAREVSEVGGGRSPTVVGYRLDYNDQYRNLPFLAALDEDDLAKGPSA